MRVPILEVTLAEGNARHRVKVPVLRDAHSHHLEVFVEEIDSATALVEPIINQLQKNDFLWIPPVQCHVEAEVLQDVAFALLDSLLHGFVF